MTKANYGKRFIAVIIDWLFAAVPSTILLIIGMVMLATDSGQASGVLFVMLGLIMWFFLSLWNKIFKEGKSGQSVGKSSMKIRLVDAESGLPIGAGRCFLREFVFSLLSSISAGLFWLIDYLWPLWDSKGERLMDKIMTSRVITC